MKYQNFVIKNGRFIGKFDEMYKFHKDPWNLIKNNQKGYQINYHLIFKFCEDLKKEFKKKKIKVLELGCGYPQIINELKKKGFDVYGLDISKTVIEKAKKKYPTIKTKIFNGDILDKKILKKIKPDIYIMNDITWYILPKIKKLISNLKKIKKTSYLVHCLTMYERKKQKYGKNYFYNLKGTKKFFNLKYLFSGEIYIEKEKRRFSFFVAKIN